MRALITVLPDTGCFYSVLPVAEALRDEGHPVAFSSSASFRPSVEAHGFDYFPAGLDWQTSDPRYFQTMLEHAGSPDLTRLTGTEPLAWLPWAREFLCSTAARMLVPDVIDVAKQWQPDIVLRDAVEFGGCVAAEALGLPHASVATTADSALDLRALVSDELDRLRLEVGLDADPRGMMLYRYLHLSLTPPSFDGADASFPETIHFLRYASRIRTDDSLPEWFDSLPDAPLALVNLGMVFHQIPGLFQDILDALSDEALNVIVATGSTAAADALRSVPPNVRVTPWIPYALVMPRCDVFITHGGMSSMRDAFRCGVPLVVLPVFGDQMYSAVRCSALGLGQVLMPDRRDPEQIAEAIQTVLREPRYRARAQQLRAELESLPEIDHAVRLLERVAAESESVPPSASAQQAR